MKQEEKNAVISGTIERLVDYAFNPSREKIREMTVIDRLQARFFPILDIINMGTQYLIQCSTFTMMGEEKYKKYAKENNLPLIPLIPNLCDEWLFRTAQWNKSVGGTNLNKAIDLSLAEIESKLEDEMAGSQHDIYNEDE